MRFNYEHISICSAGQGMCSKARNFRELEKKKLGYRIKARRPMLRGGFRAGKTPWGGTHPGRGRKERSEHSCGTQAGEEVREEPRGHASIQGASQEQGGGRGAGSERCQEGGVPGSVTGLGWEGGD